METLGAPQSRRPRRQMDGSPQVGPLVAQNWVLEKFQVEHLEPGPIFRASRVE